MKLAQYRQIAPIMNKEIEAVLEKHGLKMSKVRATIDEQVGIISIRLEAQDKNLKTADGVATTPEAEYYKEYCEVFGVTSNSLKADWLNQTFKSGGEEYRLVGMKSGRGSKKMLILRLRDNSMRVTTSEQIILIFNAKKAAA